MEAQALTWERGRPAGELCPYTRKYRFCGYRPAGSTLADEAKRWHNRFMF